MHRILSASKDTYITNKIVNNSYRVTDANVGQAGTLDLFKLYAESISGSDDTPTELSRLLIKFDVESVAEMHNNKIIDVGDASFKAYLKLHDVYGGQTTPSNFKIIAFPLSQSFDEGVGYDIVNYRDLDATNWITASLSSNESIPWNLPGALKSGSLGDESIDVIVSGTVSGEDSSISLCGEQLFSSGEEDLFIDMTNFVSASAKNLIKNHGFCIGFSGSFESNEKTYFVKRFASRNTSNTAYHPKLIIQYDDTLIDNHQNFEFDYSGSLYLNNFNRGSLSNLLSGSTATEIVGEKCMILKIQTGSFKKQFDVSQFPRGESKKASAVLSIAASGSIEEGDSFTLTDYLGDQTTFQFYLSSSTTSSSSAQSDLVFADYEKSGSYTDTFILSSSAGTGYQFLLSGSEDVDNLTIDISGFSSNENARDGIKNFINNNLSNVFTATDGLSTSHLIITQVSGGAGGNKTNSTSLTSGSSYFTLSSFSKGYDNAIGILDTESAIEVAQRITGSIKNNLSAMSSSFTGSISSETSSITIFQSAAGTLGNQNNLTSITGGSALGNFSGGVFSGLTGIYSSSFSISSFDENIVDHILASGSVTFDEIWSNHNETITYLSSSIKIKRSNRTSLNFRENRINVSMLNLKSRYRQTDIVKLRVFAENADRPVVFVKKPFDTPSEIFENMFYRIRDFESGDVIVPFDTDNNSTKLSADSTGMYFDFYMSSLPRGRSYIFDFLIKQNDFDTIIKDAASKFIVE